MSTTFQPSLIDNLAQNINPWSWVSKIASGQIGFINVNLGKSSDPGLEREISTTSAATGASSARHSKRCSST